MEKLCKIYENILKENSDIMLYHGTSENFWNERHKGKSLLYLSNDIIDSENYAYETASHDETNGLKPKPILMKIPLKIILNLKNIIIGPDWGVPKYDKNTKWEKSLSEVGGLTIYGNIDDIKHLFNKIKLY